MLDFITTYGGSIAVGAAVLAMIALIIVKFVKDKRAGRSSCGCDCAACGCGCHIGENKENNCPAAGEK